MLFRLVICACALLCGDAVQLGGGVNGSTYGSSGERLCPVYQESEVDLATERVYRPCGCDVRGTADVRTASEKVDDDRPFLSPAHMKGAMGSPQGVFAAMIRLHSPGGYGKMFSDVVREHGTHETGGLQLFLAFLKEARKHIKKERLAKLQLDMIKDRQLLGRAVDDVGGRGRGDAVAVPAADREPITLLAGSDTGVTTTRGEFKRTRRALRLRYREQMLGGPVPPLLGAENSDSKGGGMRRMYSKSHVSSVITLDHLRKALQTGYTKYIDPPFIQLDVTPEDDHVAVDENGGERGADRQDERQNGEIVKDRSLEGDEQVDEEDGPGGSLKNLEDAAHDWLFAQLLAQGRILWKSERARKTALNGQDVPDRIVLQEAWTFASEYHSGAKSANSSQYNVEPQFTVLDLGANLGMWSLLAAAVYKAEVLAFEPVRGNVEKLGKTLHCDNKEFLLHGYAGRKLHLFQTLVGAPDMRGQGPRGIESANGIVLLREDESTPAWVASASRRSL
eukprot:g14732.t1